LTGRFDNKIALSRGEAEWDCPQAKGNTAESCTVVAMKHPHMLPQFTAPRAAEGLCVFLLDR